MILVTKCIRVNSPGLYGSLLDIIQNESSNLLNRSILLDRNNFEPISVLKTLLHCVKKRLIVELDFFGKIVPYWVYFGQVEDLKLTTELSEKVQYSHQTIKNGLNEAILLMLSLIHI